MIRRILRALRSEAAFWLFELRQSGDPSAEKSDEGLKSVVDAHDGASTEDKAIDDERAKSSSAKGDEEFQKLVDSGLVDVEVFDRIVGAKGWENCITPIRLDGPYQRSDADHANERAWRRVFLTFNAYPGLSRTREELYRGQQIIAFDGPLAAQSLATVARDTVVYLGGGGFVDIIERQPGVQQDVMDRSPFTANVFVDGAPWISNQGGESLRVVIDRQLDYETARCGPFGVAALRALRERLRSSSDYGEFFVDYIVRAAEGKPPRNPGSEDENNGHYPKR